MAPQNTLQFYSLVSY